jgi:predicted SAM-dependent methyltransferase
VTPPPRPVLVNIGCGRIVHPAWLNFDLVPDVPGVLPLNANRGIPLATASVDACYSSHFLEHLSYADAQSFLREQYRVLRPGGVIRVVVPNLETACLNYLAELCACRDNGSTVTFRYEHRVAELIDQLVRNEGACRLVELWNAAPPSERAWVVAQVGYVAEAYCGSTAGVASTGSTPLAARLTRNLTTAAGRQRLWNTLGETIVASVAFAIGGQRLREAVRIGMFRSRGEVHLWMYDSLSLASLLTRNGFGDAQESALGVSRIACWEEYGLESRDGAPLKPGSLVLEAVKLL